MAETASGDIAPAEVSSVAAEPGIAARFRGVGFRYPTGTEALAGLDLEIRAGEVTGIVGPSGCGKSTTLALLAGLAQATAGSVELAPSAREGHPLSMVFQQDTLLPWLTVEQNVGLHFRFRGGARQAKDEVASLLEMIGLDGFARAYPKQLSGGMRRRAAFLAGIAPRPNVLLLDEPFSSVDEPSRVRIHQEVLGIVESFKTTTVLVTHDLAEAITLSSSVAIFSARPGRVVAVHEIPFGSDRNVLELRDTPEFLELYGRLWHELSTQIAKSAEVDAE
ncbi:MAG TPA: ATP-binding cassette domain-containing protein [Gaiellaceae bacterium]|jgi:NitT/TauT family transport system ATP-binding protein|nr:ATP-binding cassette domain-containing protein [Gaiellaceae bacterium]